MDMETDKMHVIFQHMSALHEVSMFAKMLRTFWPPDIDASSPITLFAPDNQAMRALRTAKLEQLLRRISVFQDILRYHMVPGLWPASELIVRKKLTSVQGEPLSFRSLDGIRVQTARLTDVDQRIEPGVLIHTIDRVLIPKPIDDIVEAELSQIAATESSAWPFPEHKGVFQDDDPSAPAPRIVRVRRMGHQYLVSSPYGTFDSTAMDAGTLPMLHAISDTYSAAHTRYYKWRG